MASTQRVPGPDIVMAIMGHRTGAHGLDLQPTVNGKPSSQVIEKEGRPSLCRPLDLRAMNMHALHLACSHLRHCSRVRDGPHIPSDMSQTVLGGIDDAPHGMLQ